MHEKSLYSTPLNPETLVDVQDGTVVSRTIIDAGAGSVTLFAFARGQQLSVHTAPFDALVQILSGQGVIVIDGEEHRLDAGGWIVMPADVPHAVRADDAFKMALVMIRGDKR